MNIRDVLFNLKYGLFRPQSFKKYKSLKASQFWSLDELTALNYKKKSAIVRFAFENVPLYRKLYSEVGFQLGDMVHSDYFEKLPVLKKEHIRNDFNQLVYEPLKPFASISTTGGSTGVPTKIMYDKRYPYESLGWRMMGWWGIKPSDNGAYVWRNRRPESYKQLLNQLLWWPTRKLRMDASCMDERQIRMFIDIFNKVEPPLLQGYVGAVAELAEYIESSGTTVHKPRAIWLTSAPVTKVQRCLVERVFGAPVYDQYGCCEVPHIAAQCSQREGLHLHCESVAVNVVDDNDAPVPNGSWGKLLLTKLDEKLFPLIRYEVGDNGRYLEKGCSCGVNLPLLDKVKGRISDVIRLPSGRILSGEYLTTIFDEFSEAVNAFCLVQKKNGAISISIVPSKVYSAGVGEVVLSSLKTKINGEVEISMNIVDSIAHDRGKIRFIVKE